MKNLKFGIEIETVDLTRGALAYAIQSAVGGAVVESHGNWHVEDTNRRIWKVVADASLSGGLRSGEIVSPILSYEDLETLQEVVRAVRGAGAHVNQSTGIHVYVSGDRFDAKSIINLVKLVHKQERLLEHALRIDERRLGQYCRPINPAFIQRLERFRPKTMQEVRDAWYGYRNVNPHRYDETRYHGLNLNSLFFRGSIEFRYFNGSLHAGEVKAYVQLALALAAKALKSRSTSSKRREFSPATAKYDFRVVLLSLGLIGAEYKTARLHLTKHLAGSAAWKGERRDRRPAVQEPASESEPADRAAA
ncbi:MAG TPA: amidoligase family protein [Polyangiaceae bacterium]|nr:amidoligase family protein [Polyangiaceae bacterium]